MYGIYGCVKNEITEKRMEISVAESIKPHIKIIIMWKFYNIALPT